MYHSYKIRYFGTFCDCHVYCKKLKAKYSPGLINSIERIKYLYRTVQIWLKFDKKLENIWSFIIFNKSFLEQSIWINKRMSWWCHLLTFFSFSTYFEYFIRFFSPPSNMQKFQNISEQTLFCILFSVDIRQVSLFHSWNMGYSSCLWTKLMAYCEAMTSLTHLFAYSHRLFKKCFMKIA